MTIYWTFSTVNFKYGLQYKVSTKMEVKNLRYGKIFLTMLVVVSLLLAGCAQKQAQTQPQPQQKQAEEIKPVEPTMKDTCPICGMMPAKYPQWKAQVVLKDGKRYHFDSPKDMFKFILGLTNKNEPKQWVDKNEIAAIFVTDYTTKKYIDAKKAYYVKGSDVQGPMGDDLIPFAEKEDAQKFVSEHGGEIITFGDVTVDIVKSLKMKMGGMKMDNMNM